MNRHVSLREQSNHKQQRNAYRFWAPVYDNFYGLFLKRAQIELASRAGENGGEILEVGVGTGLVLPLYPSTCTLTGIDISDDMLSKARQKLSRKSFAHVKDLQVMDACNMSFPTASFDVVSLPFVITLIPNTHALLDECARVLKPNGKIVIVSRINENAGIMRRLSQAVSPVAQSVGLSSSFHTEAVEAWVRQNASFRVVENWAIPPTGFFRLLQLSRS